MIEEAKALGMPSLLTDTRHKVRWVLLGSADGDLAPHLREQIGAGPLLGYRKFMEAERLARGLWYPIVVALLTVVVGTLFLREMKDRSIHEHD